MKSHVIYIEEEFGIGYSEVGSGNAEVGIGVSEFGGESLEF